MSSDPFASLLIQYDRQLFRPIDVEHDGNCLYRSIIESDVLNCFDHETLRKATMTKILRLYHAGDDFIYKLFKSFFGHVDASIIATFVSRQVEDNQWGDMIDMCCISYVFGVNIISIRNLLHGLHPFMTRSHFATVLDPNDVNPLDESAKKIFLYYHRFGQPERPGHDLDMNHFCALQPLGHNNHPTGKTVYNGAPEPDFLKILGMRKSPAKITTKNKDSPSSRTDQNASIKRNGFASLNQSVASKATNNEDSLSSTSDERDEKKASPKPMKNLKKPDYQMFSDAVPDPNFDWKSDDDKSLSRANEDEPFPQPNKESKEESIGKRKTNFLSKEDEIAAELFPYPPAASGRKELSWRSRFIVIFFHFHPRMGGKRLEITSRVFNLNKSTVSGWLHKSNSIGRWWDAVTTMTVGHVVRILRKIKYKELLVRQIININERNMEKKMDISDLPKRKNAISVKDNVDDASTQNQATASNEEYCFDTGNEKRLHSTSKKRVSKYMAEIAWVRETVISHQLAGTPVSAPVLCRLLSQHVTEGPFYNKFFANPSEKNRKQLMTWVHRAVKRMNLSLRKERRRGPFLPTATPQSFSKEKF